MSFLEACMQYAHARQHEHTPTPSQRRPPLRPHPPLPTHIICGMNHKAYGFSDDQLTQQEKVEQPWTPLYPAREADLVEVLL